MQRDHFRDFLKLHKDDFENTSLSTVDGELQLWEQHWENSKVVLPDSVSELSKQHYEYWVQYLLHLVHGKDHFLL